MRLRYLAKMGGMTLLVALLMTLFAVDLPGLGTSSVAVAEDAPASTEVAAGEAVVEGEEEATGPTPIYAPKLTAEDYPTIPGFNGRVVVWMVAQLHLWFAAFVLAVPIFVFIIEVIGMRTRDKRYDDMAYEFIKVSITAFSLTAILGGLLFFSLMIFYPHLMGYMIKIFDDSMIYYALLFFAESAFLYLYYYGWHWLQGGFKKWVHLTLGLLLNAAGSTLMLLANSWTTFMMSPSGMDPSGAFVGDIGVAMGNFLWNPINIHRIVANVAFGGGVVGAYAAYKFLSARTPKLRAHYDWMGYTANIIAISALLPLPFAGYYLTAEIYMYSQQMGITLMGGIFAWLFIIQAVLIGALFLSANYYLWCGMGRSDGAERYNKYIKYIAIVMVAAFLVWFTPHTLVMTNAEQKSLGAQYHPILGVLGIMPAKNTAVNLMINCTLISFILFRRCNKIPVVSWTKAGNAILIGMFAAGAINILFLGTYHGYFTNTVYKVAASIPQVLTTFVLIVMALIIDSRMYKGAKEVGPMHWGRIPDRAQYALFILAVSFTWLMGLMGYIRSGIRQHWHVKDVFRDASPDAFTPTLGFAADMVSIATLIFMAMVIFVFWLSQVSGKKTVVPGYWKEG
ncbi:hypothetical protein MNBD_GAMMA26-884 [hydrothermal vent metagenome]|uniref:Cytochrome d ubiquinol oxidase subunit I n=1 Tax=hydrothermal vent metagenome TaxID=652676 RepID=A0A3B1C324_9ZZZZ